MIDNMWGNTVQWVACDQHRVQDCRAMKGSWKAAEPIATERLSEWRALGEDIDSVKEERVGWSNSSQLCTKVGSWHNSNAHTQTHAHSHSFKGVQSMLVNFHVWTMHTHSMNGEYRYYVAPRYGFYYTVDNVIYSYTLVLSCYRVILFRTNVTWVIEDR